MFWTIPTLMTWARIVAIPLIVGVFYAPFDPASRNTIAALTACHNRAPCFGPFPP